MPDGESEQAWWLGRRVEICLLAGHVPEALALVRSWPYADRASGVLNAANSLAAHGQRPAARELLTDALGRVRDPQARYGLQAAFVNLFCTAPDVPMEEFTREMRRLERLAQASPGQQARFTEDREADARARGATDWLEAELRQQWRNGAGDIAAGDGLAKLYLDQKRWETLRALVAAINARPNLPETTLSGLAARLVKAGQAPMALALSERLCRRFPQNATYSLLRARARWDDGQRAEATKILDTLDASGIFREGSDVPAANLWLELGERAQARASLQRALERDPSGAHTGAVRRRLVALDLEDRRLDEATDLLPSAYRDASPAELVTLATLLDAAGLLVVDPSADLPGGDLPLTFARRAQWLVAVCERLQADRRTDDLWRLAQAHPELLPAAPALVASLRRTATAAQLPALAGCLREAIRRAEDPSPRLEHELARTLVRQAEASSDAATNFLTEAYELAPDDFAVVRPLAETFRRQGQTARAAEVLKPFLTADALPSEREAARQTLGVH